MDRTEREDLATVGQDTRAGILAQEMATRISREVRLAMEDLAKNHALTVTAVYVDIEQIGAFTRLTGVRIETETGGIWHG